jgi:hypothetical protein
MPGLTKGETAGDHILADTEAIGDVMNWFAGRFAGLPATSNC